MLKSGKILNHQDALNHLLVARLKKHNNLDNALDQCIPYLNVPHRPFLPYIHQI